MWYVKGASIKMAEGDYGLKLPITITGTEISTTDSIRITIKEQNKYVHEPILVKEYQAITNNTVEFELTAAESAEIPAGNYYYSLDWYRNGMFVCNIIPAGLFRVVKKA